MTIPSKREGFIQPSVTSQPPKFTAFMGIDGGVVADNLPASLSLPLSLPPSLSPALPRPPSLSPSLSCSPSLPLSLSRSPSLSLSPALPPSPLPLRGTGLHTLKWGLGLDREDGREGGRERETGEGEREEGGGGVTELNGRR